jgi:hypothetical protein
LGLLPKSLLLLVVEDPLVFEPEPRRTRLTPARLRVDPPSRLGTQVAPFELRQGCEVDAEECRHLTHVGAGALLCERDGLLAFPGHRHLPEHGDLVGLPRHR